MGILYRRLSTAQKWLKDRRGKILSFEEIQHYQRLVAALKLTDDLMGEIV
jgi:hypothetical protein